MERLIDVASYICNRYYETNGERIDEMKLHKLLYFVQRESLVQNGEPMFKEVFYGWKYGPILKEIRNAYRDNTFLSMVAPECVERIMPVMNKIFTEYANKDSWSLSRLTHGEISWKNSRQGISEQANSDNPILLDDIAKDAEKVRTRRRQLENLMGNLGTV